MSSVQADTPGGGAAKPKSLLKNWGVWLGLLVSAVSLYFFLRQLSWVEVARVLGETDYLWLYPPILINVLCLWLRAVRWRYLLIHIKPTRIWPLFVSNSIGYMANNLLPARLGEFARVFVTSRKEKVSASAALASLVVERLFDFLAVLFLYGAVIVATRLGSGLGEDVELPAFMIAGGWFSLGMSGAMIAAILVMTFLPDVFTKVVNIGVSFLPHGVREPVQRIAENFLTGISLFRSPVNTLIVAGYSVAMWGLFGFANYFIFMAFHVPSINIWHAQFLVVALAFAIMIPSAPGAVGLYHLAAAKALTMMFGADVADGVAGGMSIMLHLLNVMPSTVLGLMYMSMEGMSFHDIRDQSIEVEEQSEELVAEV